MIKAVIFDIGHTLVQYRNPLNWSKLYRPAFSHVAEVCGYDLSEEDYEHVGEVLSKYNTRIHPREYEVSSAQIFAEIISGTEIPMKDLEKVKDCFYSYFRQGALIFPEVEETLRMLQAKNILLGTLSDVPYGMDNVYALEDIASIAKYIQYPFTSNDVGYRKPCVKGLLFCAEKMQVDISEIIFVGDEEKDIICANNAGAYSVLINRSDERKEYGQAAEINSLLNVIDISEM